LAADSADQADLRGFFRERRILISSGHFAGPLRAARKEPGTQPTDLKKFCAQANFGFIGVKSCQARYQFRFRFLVKYSS
jgi:hypothetical protein